MSHGDTVPEISILVPIYNVERYLAECLDSIAGQTFGDFEAILINDGSTDGSRDIVERYLRSDDRMRVIDKENSGYGASMNRGFAEARGKYVAILESDDIMHERALEVLHAAAEDARADVAKANFWLYWSAPEERREPFDVITPTMAGRVCKPVEDEDKTIFYQKPSIWSAIYRRDFLEREGIRFLETPGASFQDASFNFKVWAFAERVVYVADYVLSYRQDNEGSSVNNPGKMYCVCDEYAEMRRVLDERPELDQTLRGVNERMKFDAYMWNAMRLAPELRVEFLDHARQELLADREAGYVDESLLGVYKRTDLRYLLDDYDSFVRALATYGESSMPRLIRHYLQLGGPILVTSMTISEIKRRRA